MTLKSLSLVTFLISVTTPLSGQLIRPENRPVFNTVTGEIQPSELGLAFTHEHIMSNFGKDIDEASIYEEEKLLEQVIPYLKHLKTNGVNTIFDCTTAYFGRRPDILKTISDSTGVQVITNTGFYGAANDRYVPELAYEMASAEIAQIWIDEFRNGIGNSGIKPGFIKLAFDDGPTSEIDKKLFEAGIVTHLTTGLTLAVHTGDNLETAQYQTETLKGNGVHPSAWVWVHANKVLNEEILIDYAQRGTWISLDGVNQSNIEEYVERLQHFKRRGLLHKVLLSHDGNSFPAGGAIREFDAIVKDLVPALKGNGFSPEEISLILIQNPISAFQVSVKHH